jgi:mevalonate kinase
MKQTANFYAKILLFGEYGIIDDSMGLSIPFNFYKGTIKFDSDKVQQAKPIRDFLNYMRTADLPEALDLDALEADLNEGLYFDSSIPQGFGVGSSGALCAALYDRYAVNKIFPNQNTDKQGILRLKKMFSAMESYFHGKSSGLDPLICYLNIPILIRSKEDLGTVDLPSQILEGKGAIFLLNSGQPGETEPMVNIFMEKMKQDGFRTMLKDQFKKYNDASIKAFLKGEFKPMLRHIKELSNIALQHFNPMIPEKFHQVWEKGIDSGLYYLKLCGSGGGGYILGFTPDFEKAQPHLADYQPEVIYRF